MERGRGLCVKGVHGLGGRGRGLNGRVFQKGHDLNGRRVARTEGGVARTEGGVARTEGGVA